jgi:hypothetical protein
MTDKKFYTFSENNDHEGETWNFYISLTDEEAIHFSTVMEQASVEAEEFPYEFDAKDTLTEKEVDFLVKRSRGGYMSEHNKVKSLKKPILELTTDDFLENDIFYKGDFFR